MKKISNLKLFFLFMYISATTFGGGYAMFPVLERELIEKRKIVTKDDLSNYIALGQSTPGIIAVNIATFVGYKQKGVLGAILATLGVITPSIILGTLFGRFAANFSDMEHFKAILKGISAAACGMITVTAFDIIKKEVKLWYVIIACAGLSFLGISGAIIAILAVLLGAFIHLKKRK